LSQDHVADAAANLAGWHDSSLRALKLRTEQDAALWSSREAGPMVFFSGVTLGGPDASDEQLRAIEGLLQERHADDFAVCDSFATLDLAPLGFEVLRLGTWMVRMPAEPVRRPFPRDLAIERVVTPQQLAEWEAASATAFGAPPLPEVGAWHAPAILSDPRMQVFAGKVGDRVVCGSMAYFSDRVNGIYAVSTLAEYRHKGYAEWLTWRGVLARPHQPATLQPSEQAEALYRHMGFEDTGEYVVWRHRPGSR
jgi:hypothetical protein